MKELHVFIIPILTGDTNVHCKILQCLIFGTILWLHQSLGVIIIMGVG